MTCPHDWAARAWPEQDWTGATLAHGAFHEVLMLAPVVVARIAIGEQAHERTEREAALLGVMADLPLPVSTPAALGSPVTAGGRSGQLTSHVAGEHREQATWADARGGFAELLAALGPLIPRRYSASCLELAPGTAARSGQRSWPIGSRPCCRAPLESWRGRW